jgi:hypothetical protein
MFNNRRWLIIPTSITGSINFNEVLEMSVDTLRISIDGTKTFVKYDITEVTSSYTNQYIDANTCEVVTTTVESGIYGRPSFYSEEYEEYTHEEMINILSNNEWTVQYQKED